MTGFQQYDAYDALGLAALVRAGEVGANELLDEALARLDALNPQLNVVTVRFEDRARAAIEAGLPDGPFHGVPFLLKDLGAEMRDTPLTNGSRLYEDFICDFDSTLVARYKRAGLVIFGRTTSPELGLSYATEPLLHGPARNPWDLDHTPGGSSGGAAAAVAARILPIAQASDGGGSIRVPASCCGLFGLKPTRGRSPTGPRGGEGWAGMSVSHAVTLSVRDSAALLDAIIGEDVGDPYLAPPPARPFLEEAGADPGVLRIAVSGRPSNGVPVDPDCLAAMDHAAALCTDLGHHVEEAEPDYDRDEIDEQRIKIIACCLRAGIGARAAELGVAPESLVEPMTWYIASLADQVSGADYAAAVGSLHRVGRQIGRFFTAYDLLLTPTLAKPPLPIGALDPATEDFEAYAAEIQGFAAFPALSNATGAPAMSVPLTWNAADLPIGAQFIAGFGDEATLFRLAAQLEAAQPWANRRPGVVGG
jgi:Asp-tRNA(Asn)/Glu-tRNA(Gln) amidotransferase A subunit family amidase